MEIIVSIVEETEDVDCLHSPSRLLLKYSTARPCPEMVLRLGAV